MFGRDPFDFFREGMKAGRKGDLETMEILFQKAREAPDPHLAYELLLKLKIAEAHWFFGLYEEAFDAMFDLDIRSIPPVLIENLITTLRHQLMKIERKTEKFTNEVMIKELAVQARVLLFVKSIFTRRVLSPEVLDNYYERWLENLKNTEWNSMPKQWVDRWKKIDWIDEKIHPNNLRKKTSLVKRLRTGLLRKNDYELLISIFEELKEKIPNVKEVNWNINGYTDKDQTVTELALYRKKLGSIPENICNLKNLEFLFLRSNQLTSLPNNLGKLKNLRGLDLGENRLSSLPKSIAKLNNLQKLFLHHNQFDLIPEEIWNLKNLRSLALFQNNLVTLHEKIGKLTKLEEIFLRYNQLRDLPSSLGKLSNLKMLNIVGNKLTSIPETLGNLSNLQQLGLSNNRLITLPKTLGKLENLENLLLNNNQLTNLPTELGNLTKLKHLEIANNQLTTFPESFTQLTQLEFLNFMGNKITTLPESLVKWLALLKQNKCAIYFNDDGFSTTNKNNINIFNWFLKLPQSVQTDIKDLETKLEKEGERREF